MKVHYYKSHKVTNYPTTGTNEIVRIKGICGGVTSLIAVEREDIASSVRSGCSILMFTLVPDKVTCGSCRRAKTFSLLELASLEL